MLGGETPLLHWLYFLGLIATQPATPIAGVTCVASKTELIAIQVFDTRTKTTLESLTMRSNGKVISHLKHHQERTSLIPKACTAELRKFSSAERTRVNNVLTESSRKQ